MSNGAPAAGSSKTGEARNPGFSDEKKAHGFGAEGMKGYKPGDAPCIQPGSTETSAQKTSNKQGLDKA